MSDTEPLKTERKHSLSSADSAELKGLLFPTSYTAIHAHAFAEGYPTLAHLARHLQRSRQWLSADLMEQISWLAGHTGTSLLLQNAVAVPAVYSTGDRERLKQRPESHWLAENASQRVTAILGAAGLRPLTEVHDERGEFPYVHVKGPEETQAAVISTHITN